MPTPPAPVPAPAPVGAPPAPPETLYIIDGYGQFFRAYHAIRTPMTSPVTKEPTNMAFGFVGMLLKLLRAESPNMARAGKPSYLAVALDVSGDRGTFRSQVYPAYKATRPPVPEDLFPQIKRCVGILGEIGVPLLGAEGYEADDVIASLVTRLRRERPELRIRIVSKDKDLKQLLETTAAQDGAPSGRCGGPPSPAVELFDVHTDAPYDAACLLRDTGLRPDQVIDMLTLMGDAVDNVPGVEGVGEKTAALLLKEWGTVENLLAHAGNIKGKRGENLRAAASRLPLSRQLVTLHRDLPVEMDLADASVRGLRLDALQPILRELGFNRYQDDVRALLGEPAAAGVATSSPAATRAQPAARAAAPAPASNTGQGGLFDAVGAVEAAKPRAPQDGVYRCITTLDQLREVVRECERAEVVSIDTETTSLSPLDAELCGVSLSVRPGAAVYIPTLSPTPEAHLDARTVLDALRPMLEEPALAKCGHNLKYDLLVLRRHGVELRGLTAEGACDSMVASYLIDASRSSHGLDSLSLALLNRTNISITELIGTGKNQRTFDQVPIDQATQYAAEDADVALQLRELMMPQLRAMGIMPLMHAVEMPMVEVLAELEWNGIAVDPDELDRQRVRLQGKIDELLRSIRAESVAAIGRTFEPDSPRQLAVALFNNPTDDPPGLGIRGQRRTKTGYSTDAEVLDKLALDDAVTTPIPRLVLEYRQLSKLVSTYLVALKAAIHPRTHRVHASFNQTVAATGRLSSSDPNLQNIPIRTDVGREIRRAFVAPPGRVLVTADYSQIELRLLAHLSRDPALIEAFRIGADIHTAVAAQIHGVPLEAVTKSQRSGAKMVNFGIVYGVTAFGLARRLKIETGEAATIIADYKRQFAGITTFLQECIEQARRFGYVETLLKRRRPIPGIDDPNPSRRALAERLAINTVVQGTAADLIKLAMVDIHRRLPEDARLKGVRMLLQIHDELVFEAPAGAAEAARDLVVHRMEHAMELAVPLRADAHIGRNWFEGK